jgi:NitT/TauT family transport system permease protein
VAFIEMSSSQNVGSGRGTADPLAAAMSANDRARIAKEQSIIDVLRREKRNRQIKVWVVRILSLVFWLACWEIASRLELVQSLLISRPTKVWDALVDFLSHAPIYVDIWATLFAVVVGLTLGTLVGIAAGIMFAKLPIFYQAVGPYLTILNAMPRPALAPIFLVWFGLGAGSKVTVAMSIVLFILLLSTVAGIKAVDEDIGNLADSLAISPWKRFTLIELPSALPFIVAGLRLAAVYSVLGVIVTEMVASYAGLGQRLILATTNIQMGQAFAVILMAASFAVMMSGAVSLLENYLRRRWYQ